MNQDSLQPTSKVTAAGVGGALTIVLVYLVKQIFDVDVPAEVAAAITTLVAFGAGYMKRENIDI